MVSLTEVDFSVDAGQQINNRISDWDKRHTESGSGKERGELNYCEQASLKGFCKVALGRHLKDLPARLLWWLQVVHV